MSGFLGVLFGLLFAAALSLAIYYRGIKERSVSGKVVNRRRVKAYSLLSVVFALAALAVAYVHYVVPKLSGDERAWLAVTSFNGKPEVDKPCTVDVRFKNTGRTPATDVRGVIYFYAAEAPGKPPGFERVTDEDMTKVPPGTSYSSAVVAPGVEPSLVKQLQYGTPVIREEMGLISNRKLVIYAYGKIAYKDVFGCSHWTTFCGTYNPLSGRYEACEELNATDKNECS